MDISVQSTDTFVELSPTGRIDQVSAPQFQEELLKHTAGCKEDGHMLIVNMSGVDFISSVGLRAFMIATKTTRPQKGRLAVTNMNDVVREVFQISRFDKVVECYDTVESAKNA